jgi:hypothetical protein
MKHKEMSTKTSGKRSIGIVSALAVALLGLFMTAAPALAAPATAQTSSHSRTADVSARPLIQGVGCNSSTTHWVHVYMDAGTWCYGFTGTWNFGVNNTFEVCSGNNYGTLEYYFPDVNSYFTWRFVPGSYKLFSDVKLIYVTITGWSGSDTC